MKYATIVIIAILILLGLWWLVTMDPADENMDTELNDISQDLPGLDGETPGTGTTDDQPIAGDTTDDQPAAGTDTGPVTVTYSSSGFSPATVTVSPGTPVTFINESGRSMWVASDEHPTHTSYDGTSRTQHCPDPNNNAFDQCAAGETYSFTFSKSGTWEYHNHLAPQNGGTVIVQ